MHIHTNDSSCPQEATFLDMRLIKNKNAILEILGIQKWMDLRTLKAKIFVNYWERMNRHFREVAEALVYASTENVELVTSSRYNWYSFNIYSPFLEEKFAKENKEKENEPFFKLLHSMMSAVVSDFQGMEMAYQRLKPYYDSSVGAFDAFRNVQTPASRYLAQLGTFDGTLCV